jgi:3-methyladenine DNA glycosylase/8-oxoguanine DNA glycosylase
MKSKLQAAERHLVETDPKFARIIAAAGPCALRRREEFDPFSSLAEAIVSQQLSGKAAATIHGRIPALFGGTAFPTARQVLDAPPEFLRPAGLSAAKTLALRDLAARVLDGTVPPSAELHRLGDEELVERISRVRGIGRWTVEMLLIFDLGRLDVFPVDDLGVRNGFVRLFRRPGAKKPEMVRRAERWRPYRSVASWYLWRVLDTKEPAG